MDSSNKLVDLIREISKDSSSDIDRSIICYVEDVNADGTLNIKLPSDIDNVIKNVPNNSPYTFESGDYALLYKIGNKLNNSFVLTKVTKSPPDIKRSNDSDQNIIVTNNYSGGGGGGGGTSVYVAGVEQDRVDFSSDPQTQISGKQPTITGGASTITSSNLSANFVLTSNDLGKVVVSNISTTELEYLDGVTSNIQDQLDIKANSSSLANVATSGSYNDLVNTPTIPTVNNGTLTIQRNGVDLGNFSANQGSNVSVNISVPTKTSDLTNDGDGSSNFATESFVNSSVATNTAYFRGTYDIVVDLGLTTSATESQIATALAAQMVVQSITPTNNDYCFVAYPDATDPTQYTKYDRYKYDGSDSLWEYEYTLNNSSFTATQWAAINSGATSTLIGKITTNETAINNIKDGTTIDSFSDVETALSDKVDKNSAITGATKCKITYDSKGLVTSGADLQASDIPNLDANKVTSGTFDATRIPSLPYLSDSTKYGESLHVSGTSVSLKDQDGTVLSTITTQDTNDNQTIKGNGVSFGINDSIDIKGGGIISVVGNNSSKDITISASHQSIKSIDTNNSTTLSVSDSESVAGSGIINLHKISKTGSYNDLLDKPTIPTDTNQTIKTSSVTFGADDAVQITAGSNVQVDGNASAKTITISATDTTYTSKAASQGGTDVSLVTTGEKYIWDNKQDALSSQTAYTSKGTSTKVPTISTNNLGQVTGITETDISFPDVKIDGVSIISNNSANIMTEGGSYNASTNKILTKGDVSSVAISGSYSDLTDTPSIPAAQIQSDWNQSNSAAVDYIKNKPDIPAAQIQSNWTQSNSSAVDYIQNKPTIPTVNDGVLTIQRNGVDVGNFSANQSTNISINISVPTALSDLSDDSTHRLVTDTQISNWNSKLDDVKLNNVSVVDNGSALLIADTVVSNNSSSLVTSGAVYNSITDVTEIAEGKTKNYVISDIITGTNIVNSNFNSTNNTVAITISGNKISDIQNNNINLSDLKIGDIISVIELDVPDRWVGSITSSTITFYKLETKFDIDSSPTQSSVNPVSSGGVYTALTYKVDGNATITGATKCKITYDSKGLVTAGADLQEGDVPNLSASKITSGTFDSARIPSLSYLPDSTKYGKSLSVSGTSVSLKDQDGTVLSTITTQDTNTATAEDDILDGSNIGTQITYKPYTTQQSKLSFDTSSNNPERTDRLNLNGNLYVTNINSPQSVYTISSLSTVAGSATSGSVLSVRWYVSGVNGITTPYDGMKIVVKIPLVGVATGGVILSLNGNNANDYHPVSYNNTTVLTGHYPVNTYKMFTYDATASMTCYKTSGTSVPVTGVWKGESNYDSGNTTYSAMSTAELLAGTATNQRTMRADYLNPAIQAYATHYGTCSTAANTSIKEVSIADTNWQLRVGVLITVKFTNTNTATTTYLRVNSDDSTKGRIWFNTGLTDSWAAGSAGRCTTYMWDGSQWLWVSHGTDNNTTYSSLKNPYAITIQGNGANVSTYDGSEAKIFNWKPSTTNGAFEITDGTITKTVQLAGKFTDTATAVDNILDGSNSGTAITYAPYSSKGAGHLYTGTTLPSSTNRLNYDGYFYATQIYATSFTASSDYRLKENIKDWAPQKSILDLQIKEFDFKDSKSHHIGCIAQDLQEICPEIVYEGDDGYLGIEESKLVYLLLDEVKKLKKEIEELKKGV